MTWRFTMVSESSRLVGGCGRDRGARGGGYGTGPHPVGSRDKRCQGRIAFIDDIQSIVIMVIISIPVIRMGCIIMVSLALVKKGF
jgi:hypothetical protein